MPAGTPLTRERLEHAMRLCRTVAKAAQMLGAHRVSVSKACKRYGIPCKLKRVARGT